MFAVVENPFNGYNFRFNRLAVQFIAKYYYD